MQGQNRFLRAQEPTRFLYLLSLSFLFSAAWFPCPAYGIVSSSANFRNTASSLDSSGQPETSPSHAHHSSVGEVSLTNHTSANYSLRSGLMPVYFYPGKVLNLFVSTGPTQGTMVLQWVAPGNDAQAPNTTARSYLIKQSTDANFPINLNNPSLAETTFDSAATVSAPAPLAQGATQTLLISGLQPGTSYFFAIRAVEQDELAGIISVSGNFVFGLSPLFVAGLDRALTVDLSSVTIVWSSVGALLNGTPFSAPVPPNQLDHYTLYRSTGLWSPPDKTVTLSTSTLSYTDWIAGQNYYYWLTAGNNSSQESEPSLIISSLSGELYRTSPNKQFLARLDRSLVPFMDRGNSTGQNIHISPVLHSGDVNGKTLQSIEFQPRQGDNGQAISHFALPADNMDLHFYYQVSGNQISFSPQLSVQDAPANLGIYWYNGTEWFKLYGQLDAGDQSIRINVPTFGKYQVRQVARAASFSVDASGITHRFITPNGDGKNDQFVIVLDNPSDSAVTAKVFDVKGRYVADMQPGPVNCSTLLTGCGSVLWDGKSNGTVVPGGVYIYQVEAEGKVFNGTVVVIR